MSWVENIRPVFQDRHKMLQAAALWYLVEGHLRQCHHKRKCAEEMLASEAEDIARIVEKQNTPLLATLDSLAQTIQHLLGAIAIQQDQEASRG